VWLGLELLSADEQALVCHRPQPTKQATKFSLLPIVGVQACPEQ